MILLRKKRITFIVFSVFLSILVFTLIKDKKEIVPTVSLPVSGNTKGEGRILMIFTKKSFLWTVACAFVGLIVGYLPIGVIFQHPFIGIAITLIFALIGFGIATLKVPNSSNFELFRKTGGENIDEIIMRAIKFKKQGKKLYLYHKGGSDNE